MSADAKAVEDQCTNDVAKLDLRTKNAIALKAVLFNRKNTRLSVLTFVDEFDAKARPLTLAYVNASMNKVQTALANLDRMNKDISDYMISKVLWDDDNFDSELKINDIFHDILVLKQEELKIEHANLSTKNVHTYSTTT